VTAPQPASESVAELARMCGCAVAVEAVALTFDVLEDLIGVQAGLGQALRNAYRGWLLERERQLAADDEHYYALRNAVG